MGPIGCGLLTNQMRPIFLSNQSDATNLCFHLDARVSSPRSDGNLTNETNNNVFEYRR